MSMVVTPDTPYGKELWQWDHTDAETHPSDPTIRGKRPSSFKAYPAMMYKATQKNPWLFDSEVAKDENQQRNLESRGYIAGGRGAAADAFNEHEKRMGLAAAERNFSDRHMSEKAKAESEAAEQASSKHLGEIPRTPVKRSRKKVATV